MRIGKTG
jgi:golgin subfamily B member 1